MPVKIIWCKEHDRWKRCGREKDWRTEGRGRKLSIKTPPSFSRYLTCVLRAVRVLTTLMVEVMVSCNSITGTKWWTLKYRKLTWAKWRMWTLSCLCLPAHLIDVFVFSATEMARRQWPDAREAPEPHWKNRQRCPCCQDDNKGQQYLFTYIFFIHKSPDGDAVTGGS